MLNLEKNDLGGKGMEIFIKAILNEYCNGLNLNLEENQALNQKKKADQVGKCALETLELTGCFLRDEGLATVLNSIIANPVIFQNLKRINLTGNRCTEFSLQCVR